MLLLFFSFGYGQVLIVETVPPFSETDFVLNDEYYYLLAEIEQIRTGSSTWEGVTWDNAQYGDFFYIRPNGWVECQVNVPVSGNYKVYMRLCQHGNSGPNVNVYVDASYKNNISGNRTWGETSVYLSAGNHTIKYSEAGSGDATWPLRLVGFDAVAVTNDTTWHPPDSLSTHPYTGNDKWWKRPSEQIGRVDVSVDDKTASFTGSWQYKDILIIDDAGNSQGTCVNFSVGGDSLAGKNLSSVSVSYGTNHRTTAGLISACDRNRITPNFDMNDDEVTLDVPLDQSGYVQVQFYNGSLQRQLPSGEYTWNGRATNEPYADFTDTTSCLLRFTPTSGGSTTLYGCVHTDPDVAAKVRPRVTEFSPNGDEVYDQAYIYLNTASGFNYQSGDSASVKNSSGSVVRSLAKTNPLTWDGKNASGQLCPSGTYSIEILDSSGQLRAGSKINLLDVPPTDHGPHDPGDFFLLGMWTALSDGYSTSSMDGYLGMNCNTFRVAGPGTYASGSTRYAAGFWSSVQSRGLKVFVNLREIVDQICEMDIAPSEPRLEMILDDWVNPIKDKTELIGYELQDEPAYNEEKGYRLRAIQQILHKLDPVHPSLPVLIGYDARISGYTSDMKPQLLLLDIYPCRDHDGIKDTHDQPGDFNNIWGYAGLEMLEYMDWAMGFVEDRSVPTWIIHQAHKFTDGLDEPTPEEIRLQIWLSLTRAVKGFYFFIYETQQSWTGIKDNPPIKSALAQIYGRLKTPAVYKVLPHLEKDNFNVSITGGGNSYGYSHGEAGALKAGTKKYIVAANRNCLSSDNITLKSSDYPYAVLKDLETGTEYSMGDLISLPPGDGRIFELIAQNPDPPGEAGELSFTEVTETLLALQWQPPSGPEAVDGYNVYSGDGTFLETVFNTSYLAQGLTPDQSYCYYVKAYNNAGQSAPSEIICEQTFPSSPPTMPDDVKVISVTSGSVEIQWDASADNVGIKGYDVYLDDVYEGTTSSTSYTFSCTPSRRYTFSVMARDVDDGQSVLSPNICAYTCEDSTPAELLGHWCFDTASGSMAYDWSNYGNNGMVYGAQWTGGYYGSALDFDGSGDKVNVGSLDVTGDELTISAWIKPGSFLFFSSDNRIISKSVGSGEEDHYWMLSTIDNNGGVRLRFRLRTNNDTVTLKGTSQEISLNQWCHVAAVYDSSEMRLYKNAVADDAVMSKSGDIDNSTGIDVLIGSNANDYAEWDGLIDDVRIYNKALSVAEISDIMNDINPLPGTGGECWCDLASDFNCDCIVDLADFGYIASGWGLDTFPGLGDLVDDDVVDTADAAQFFLEWLDEDSL